ncbi:MAG: zinc-ribbon domain-containing protein [Alphaproteobacteria bacterium]|nr:zinc-ribbon domain-containing protein [Alphaproteobacteria bacterium]
MIVTCSNCRARYAVDPLAIGLTGRTVQCARCSHRWFQHVEGPLPTPDMVIRPPQQTTSAGALPVPVPTPPAPGWGRRLAIAAFILLLVAAAGAAAYLHRDTLLGYADRIAAYLPSELRALGSNAMPRLPSPSTRAPRSGSAETATASPTTSAEATASPNKSEPTPQPAQLEVDLALSKIELIDGRYVVRGEIVNTGGSAGTARRLVVTFKKGDDVLATRAYPLALGSIAAGERLSFSQTLDNSPAGATDIVPSVE